MPDEELVGDVAPAGPADPRPGAEGHQREQRGRRGRDVRATSIGTDRASTVKVRGTTSSTSTAVVALGARVVARSAGRPQGRGVQGEGQAGRRTRR